MEELLKEDISPNEVGTKVQSIEKLQLDLHRADEVCRAHGQRLTIRRKQVLSLLLQVDKAISAYELIDLFKSNFNRTLPPMSAYRILDFLESVNLGHKLNIANKYVACAHIGCDHSHELPQFLFCQQCQRVDELQGRNTSFTDLANSAEQTGYQLASPQIELNCICNSCLSTTK